MDSQSKGNIVLVGFMGTGKTTVGQILAKRTGKEFLDMDEAIEEREQRSISDIFATDGEGSFRSIERYMVKELAVRDGLVIGTGGGIVLNPENIEDFSRSGLVLCLQAKPETILKRVEAQEHRPLLEDGEKAQKIRSLLEERKHLYAKVPHQIQTDNLSTSQVAEKICRLYRNLFPDL